MRRGKGSGSDQSEENSWTMATIPAVALQSLEMTAESEEEQMNPAS